MFTFGIKEGKLDCNGVYLADALSGAYGYADNPADESLKALGPLPEGFYTMRPAVDSPTLGKIAIELVPDAANQEYGRGGFWIHGYPLNPQDHDTGSHGCIETNPSARAFINVRIGRGDNRLEVVASLAAVPSAADLDAVAEEQQIADETT